MSSQLCATDGENPANYNDGYAERLEACYSGAVYDVLRGMGLPDQILPRTIRPLDHSRPLAGRIHTFSGRTDFTVDRHTTLLEWTKMLSRAPKDSVVICQPNDDTLAHMGELSAETFVYKGVRGYLCDGGCRDTVRIEETGLRVGEAGRDAGGGDGGVAFNAGGDLLVQGEELGVKVGLGGESVGGEHGGGERGVGVSERVLAGEFERAVERAQTAFHFRQRLGPDAPHLAPGFRDGGAAASLFRIALGDHDPPRSLLLITTSSRRRGKFRLSKISARALSCCPSQSSCNG